MNSRRAISCSRSGAADIGARDSQLVQPAMEPRHVALALEQRTADRAPYFVHAVAEHEAAVVDRNGGGGARQEVAVEIREHVAERKG